ncbi:tRNA (34-2'-O)-methyltransferase regulator WDR6-like [Diadema setosum]|uniref:tRNA (34-2'-O)-methyltransferase regulator WDR6-like n=1 Tax=Diadema setosum TaxID=31175 RepID=UPI003B3B2434
MEGSFTSAISLTITALEIAGESVIAGEGPYLHVYDISPRQSSRSSLKVLSHQVIHGIRRCKENIFAIFGHKALCIIEIDFQNKNSISILSEVYEVSDWIWDVCWLCSDEDAQLGTTGPDPLLSPECSQKERRRSSSETLIKGSAVAIATAHNAVLLWHVDGRHVSKTVHCQENCILYSARFVGQTWSSLVLAAGTVFNQVVLWRPCGPVDDSGRVIVDHRQEGHQGVIFDITYNHELQILTTVSDDRSIRLWPFRCPTTPSDDQPCKAQLELYGHSARVWRAKTLADKIVSIGEDAMCCIWDMNGRIIKKIKSHKGKSIWSLAVSYDGSYVATGGGDRSIRLWPLEAKQSQPSANCAIETIEIQTQGKHLAENPGYHGNGSPSESELVPRKVVITSDKQLLVMTQGGYICSWSNSSTTWRFVMHDEEYQGYNVMAAAPSTPLVAIGNIQGSIKVIWFDCQDTLTTEIETSTNGMKVMSVTWATDEDLMSSGMDGCLTWWKVSASSSLAMIPHAQFTLPPCRQRWATCAVVLDDDRMVCGDRRGSVHLYGCNPNEIAGPVSSLPGLHGKSGTSSVCLHEGLLYSTGRDGTYRQISITDGGELKLQNTYKVYKGFDWLEKLIFTDEGDILVLGFHSVNFVVWSTSSNEALLRVDCGGGHRAWNFGLLDDQTATFACIKMKQLLLSRVPASAWQKQKLLKNDVHGREITCIKFLKTVCFAGETYHICATGSEDTKVNIIAFTTPHQVPDSDPPVPATLGESQVLHCLHAHVSSVRALATCQSRWSKNDSHLLFSVGGRFTINCWRVKFSQKEPKTLRQVCSLHHLASHSSLISARSRKRAQRRDAALDPETRFMAVTVWRKDVFGHPRGGGEDDDDGGEGSVVMVAVASSDALLRIFAFKEGANKIVPLCSSNLHDCCLLSLTSVEVTSDETDKSRRVIGNGRALLSGGTDGRIALWDTRGVHTLVKEHMGPTGCSEEEEEEKEEEEKAEGNEHISYEIEQDAVLADGDETAEMYAATRTSVSDALEHKKNMSTIGDPLHTTSEQLTSTESVSSLSGEGKVLDHRTRVSLVDSNVTGSMSFQEEDIKQDSASSIPCARVQDALHRPAGSEVITMTTRCSLSGDACSGDSTNTVSQSDCRMIPSTLPGILLRDVLPSGSPKDEPESNESDDVDRQRTFPLSWTSQERGSAAPKHPMTSGHPGRIVLSWKAHQSGVNAMAVRQIGADLWLVVSGGDDNALTVSLLRLSVDDHSLQSSVLDVHHLHRAHAAQVTGLLFMPQELTFLSVSVDQRLNGWEVQLGQGLQTIQRVILKSCQFIHVPDVAGMDAWQDTSDNVHTVVCGQGLQLMTSPSKETPRHGREVMQDLPPTFQNS